MGLFAKKTSIKKIWAREEKAKYEVEKHKARMDLIAKKARDDVKEELKRDKALSKPTFKQKAMTWLKTPPKSPEERNAKINEQLKKMGLK